MCSLSSSRRVTEVLPEAIALLHFCAQCRRYLKPWSRTKSCRSASQTEFYCKVTNFRTVFIFVHFVLLKKYEIYYRMKISFCFEAIEFQRHFLRRPSKVRKLVRTNQFQVESTKMGTVRKFVTLQYLIASFASFPVSQLYGSCCLFWMTGMQEGKGAPQSIPPFWTWQKPLIALTTRF